MVGRVRGLFFFFFRVQMKGLNRVKIKTEKMAPLQCSKEKLCGGCSLVKSTHH